LKRAIITCCLSLGWGIAACILPASADPLWPGASPSVPSEPTWFADQQLRPIEFAHPSCSSQCDDGACGDGVNCGCAVGGNSADKPSPCAGSHKVLFYNNDFSYLNDPDYRGHCLGDCLKLMPIGPGGGLGTLDVGGQVRMRYHHERGMGQVAGATRFEPTNTDFLLNRLRLYTNWQISDRVRFYGEGIYADVTKDDDYIPRPIDRNFGDFLNLFFDVQVADGIGVRIGRQELLLGNQRLVSPLDWSNTRRTFEGVRVMTQSGDWAVDGFFTNFVPVDPFRFDEADYNQPFYGYYVTYTGFENFSLETYYFGYDNTNPGAITENFSLHTMGVRVNGGIDDWLFEMEGGPQFGRQMGLDRDHRASFITAGVGRKLGESLPWSPTLWVYYDYASGDDGTGSFNRFNHLFPLGHKYLGYIDAVQRANIQAPNVLLSMQPSSKLSFHLWYYHFMANQAGDIVPSIGGTPPQSTTERHFGDELDFLAVYQMTPRANLWFGWSHLWRGNKILAPSDADFFYTHVEVNF